MCGITGFFHPNGFNSKEAENTIVAMRNRLVHRGPDDAGVWMDGDAGIALAHRRLSILDLSPAGHQPMVSASGRYVLVFNGEIYNHLDIRRRLDAEGDVVWRGHSDTETLLATIEGWGLDATLKESVGMFALALWDRQDRTLSLARDRMGEKPLYYGWQGKTLLFGSELKALRAHPAFQSEINRDVLPLYLRHGYIPAPWSIWKGIHKLLPGTSVRFAASQLGQLPDPIPYWTLTDVIARCQSEPFTGSDKDAVDALERHLSQAIAGQRLADVPLGAFLSGGIDSSTVVALMQAQSAKPVKTFTIGFHEAGYNEATHAKAVASHLGTDHTELYVTEREAREVIPCLSEIYDEPFGDSSAIPTHMVSRLAHEQVTVSLSGDGGDELFGGYKRYFKAENLWRGGQRIPSLLRPAAAAALRSSVPLLVDALLHPLTHAVGHPIGKSVAAKCSLAANLIECKTQSAYYRAITSQWNPAPVAQPGNALDYGYSDEQLSGISEPVQRMMAQDSVTYLPDDILVKVDRAAMAVSLETRVPLLDHRVVELAWRIPYAMKVRDGQGKWLLRQVLYRHVPREMIERPKMGFGVPVDSWLRGPLREWAEDLLHGQQLQQQGYLDHKAVHGRWNQHIKGRHNWRDSLWLVLMWQAWLERNG